MSYKNSRIAINLLSSFVVTLILPLSALAQSQTQYDKGTPPQHTAGVSSLGSYVSADLGTINLSNGALNFKIPIGSVGGRGFWVPLTLNYSSKVWSATTDTDVDQQNVGAAGSLCRL